MKKILIFLVFSGFAQLGFSQVSIETEAACPDCRPIAGCGVCWETKEEAEACIDDRLGVDDEIPSGALTVSPNPTSGFFNITYNREISGTIEIFNQLGSVVKKLAPSNSKTNQLQIDATDFAPGLYFMKYYDNVTKKRATLKIVVNK